MNTSRLGQQARVFTLTLTVPDDLAREGFRLSLREGTFGVEILNVTALGACCRIYNAVDECWPSSRESVGQSLREAARIVHVIPGSAKRLDELVVAGIRDKTGR
jgi:hypothetical protein